MNAPIEKTSTVTVEPLAQPRVSVSPVWAQVGVAGAVGLFALAMFALWYWGHEGSRKPATDFWQYGGRPR